MNEKEEITEMLKKYGFKLFHESETLIQHENTSIPDRRVVSIIFLGEDKDASFYVEGEHVPNRCCFYFDRMAYTDVKDLNMIIDKCIYFRNLLVE